MRNDSPELPRSEFKSEGMNTADDSLYYIHTQIEIAAILRTIMHKNALLAIGFDEGRSLIVTAILDVDDAQGTLIFDCGPDPHTNKRLAQATRLVCSTAVDRIKVQFVCSGAEVIEHEGREAFRVPMPDKLLRLQRREYFRLTTPMIHPIKCLLTTRAGGEVQQLELNTTDISCGGFGTTSSTTLPPFALSTRFECKMALSDAGMLQATAELLNTFELALANKRMRHCGYQFIALPEKTRTLVQRYILQQQRMQRARASSLA